MPARSHTHSGKNRLLICLLILTIAAVSAAAALYFLGGTPPDGKVAVGVPVKGFDTAALVGSLNGSAAGDISPAEEFNYKINSKITVAKGRANLRMENPVENRHLMKVTLTLEDGTVIYSTDFIRPYHYIESDTLDITPKKGAYSATAKIEAFDSATRVPLMQTEEIVTLTVE